MGDNTCYTSAGFAAILLPSNIQSIPNASSLTGVWKLQEFINTPEMGFAALQNFTVNLLMPNFVIPK